jgi:iron complex outermembrane receptor protein
MYSINFKDRQATAFNPNTGVSTLTNVGNVSNKGFEIEAGNRPWHGFALYASYGYSSSEIKSDLQSTVNGVLPTKGNEMPLTPRNKAGLSVEYQDGAFWGRAKAKATSKQMATLANDEIVPGYTVFGMDGGYTFPNYGLLKRPKLTVNVSNLGNKQYRNPSSQNVTNAVAYPGVTAKTVFYYLGAPRFASVTFSADF